MRFPLRFYLAAIAAAPLLCVSASAGTIAVTSGPTFTPSDAFVDNQVQLQLETNPPGVTGDVIHLSGNTSIIPSAGGTATVEVDGAFTGAAGDNFSPIYSFTIDSTSTLLVTFQTLISVIIEPIGIPMGTSSPPVIVQPGLHQYQLAPPVLPINTLHGTYKVSIVFTFGSAAATAIGADTGALNASIQQLDFQLAPELPTLSPFFRLLNISTRDDVETGEKALIGGFITTGAAPKKVLLRALGPSLASMNVSGPLADPLLELHEPDGTVITNDNWKDTQEEEIIDTGIPPTDDRESAIVATLNSGAYTAVVRGAGDTSGVALVEIYDLDAQPAASQVANISSRGFVQTGDNVMIGGFIVGPSYFVGAPVVVRALGPSLADSGVMDALQDPTLELYRL